ncbi:hypothetical protein ACJRO7_033314 [Eucalyptus globulus]|uniref:Uncharacterized protein n=1 Tax=Eucalyptus globulus TaxID=34317 RepID=A0ABD3JMB9_EUCGL
MYQMTVLPSYLVVNANESEPGTCEYREIMRHDPRKLLEGCLIAGVGMRATAAYIYIRGEYVRERKTLGQARKEAYEAGLLGRSACGSGHDFDVHIRYGAEACICGEENALLESLEGKQGKRRSKPPFPANAGLYGCPTTVTNVETGSFSYYPQTWSRLVASFGRKNDSVTKLFCVSDHVKKPCTVEDNTWWFICTASPNEHNDVLMGYDAPKAVQSGLGTAAVVVMNKSTHVLWTAHTCREGTGWLWMIMEKLKVGNAKLEESDMLQEVTKRIEGHTICAF